MQSPNPHDSQYQLLQKILLNQVEGGGGGGGVSPDLAQTAAGGPAVQAAARTNLGLSAGATATDATASVPGLVRLSGVLTATVSTSGDTTVTLDPVQPHELVVITAGAGAGAYTRNVVLSTSNAHAGALATVQLDFPASINPTIVIRNATAGGTVLATYRGTGFASSVLLEFVFNGTAWSLASPAQVPTLDAGTLAAFSSRGTLGLMGFGLAYTSGESFNLGFSLMLASASTGSGSGSASLTNGGRFCSLNSGSIANSWHRRNDNGITTFTRGSGPSAFNFATPAFYSVQGYLSGVATTRVTRFCVCGGKIATGAGGALTEAGYGWSVRANRVWLETHNGSVLTEIDTGADVADSISFSLELISNGTGTVVLVLNGVVLAASALGPTGIYNFGGSFGNRVTHTIEVTNGATASNSIFTLQNAVRLGR